MKGCVSAIRSAGGKGLHLYNSIDKMNGDHQKSVKVSGGRTIFQDLLLQNTIYFLFTLFLYFNVLLCFFLKHFLFSYNFSCNIATLEIHLDK